MKDALQGLAFYVGIPLALIFAQIAWHLWTMPYSEQQRLRDDYARRQHDNRMIRFWLRGGR